MAAFKNAKISKAKITFLIICFFIFIFLIVNNFTSIRLAFLNIINQKQSQLIIPKTHQTLNETLNNTRSPEKSKIAGKNEIFPLVISEVFGGNQTLPSFVEIYNPSPFPISLTGASIKKIKSNKETTFVSSKRFANKIIQPYSYFLIAKEKSEINADVYWPTSYKLENKSGIILYNTQKVKVDEVYWDNLPLEKSFTRLNWQTKDFILTNPNPQKSY